MTKRNFIALADHIRRHNKTKPAPFTSSQLETLAVFCLSQNPAFDMDEWLRYVRRTKETS